MYNELYHHGVKGQKWHVRRFQNKDGSLTPAGKRRRKMNLDDMLEQNIKNGKDKSPISSAEKMAKDAEKVVTNATQISDSILKLKSLKSVKKQNNSSVKSMTDEQLRNAINRMNMERTYKSLLQSPNTVHTGMTRTNEILKMIGGVVGVASSVAGIASTIHTLTK